MPHERPGLGESIRWRGPPCDLSLMGEVAETHFPVASKRHTEWPWDGEHRLPGCPATMSDALAFLEIVSHPIVFTRFLFCSNWQSGFPCWQLQIMTDTQTKWMAIRSRREIIHIWRKHQWFVSICWAPTLCQALLYMFVIISLALTTTLCYYSHFTSLVTNIQRCFCNSLMI